MMMENGDSILVGGAGGCRVRASEAGDRKERRPQYIALIYLK